MVKKVACFITSGMTECGAMTAFLTKINPSCRYIQCFPNKPKYKRGLPSQYSGYTGDRLLSVVYRRLSLSKERRETFDAILIEDDLDGRFYEKTDQYIADYLENISIGVACSGYKDIPIILFFASPEIESWFLADWDNSFKEVYRTIPDQRLSQKHNDYFSNRLKKYISTTILKGNLNSIEMFGYDENGIYTKLSDRIQSIISIEIKETIQNDPAVSIQLKEILINNRGLYYSKNLHGDYMLRHILPSSVADKCTFYFSSAFRQLKQL